MYQYLTNPIFKRELSRVDKITIGIGYNTKRRELETDARTKCLLSSSKLGVRIARIHEHSIICDVLGFSNRVGPERRGFDPKIPYNGPSCSPDCQWNRSSVSILPRACRKQLPPGLIQERLSGDNQITVLRNLTWPFPWIPPVLYASTTKSDPVMTNQDAWLFITTEKRYSW